MAPPSQDPSKNGADTKHRDSRHAKDLMQILAIRALLTAGLEKCGAALMCGGKIRKSTRNAIVSAISVIVGTGLASAAHATSLSDRFSAHACYARTYSPDHLAKHPRQLVAHIWFLNAPSAATGSNQLALQFGFRLRDGRAYNSFAFCSTDGRCATEGDGGSVQFTDRGENLRLSVIDYLVVEGADFSPDLSQSDDRVFLLYPAATGACG